jgi:hypothetical protein
MKGIPSLLFDFDQNWNVLILVNIYASNFKKLSLAVVFLQAGKLTCTFFIFCYGRDKKLLQLSLSQFNSYVLIETQSTVKLSLCLNNYALCHEDIWRNGVIAPPFFISVLDGCESSAPYPGPLIPPYPREIAPSMPWIGGSETRLSERCSEGKHL